MMKFRIALLVAAVAISGCASSEDDESLATSSTQQPLVGGRNSTEAENYNVLISRGGTWVGGGILLAPNLVLTDRALVQELDASLQDGCQNYKRNKTGLGVQAGLQVDQLKEPIPVVQILTDGSASSCAGPLAVLELLSPIQGVPYAQLRIDELPVLGEPIRSVGWGHITGEGQLPTVRQTADGQVLLATGGSYQLAQWTLDLNPAFSLTSAPACYFDPGGPLVDARGIVIGVLHDRIGQDPNHPVGKPFAPCVGAFSTATPLSKHKAFIERSLQRYGLMPWRATQEAPPGPQGASCAQSQDCNSNMCIDVGGVGECSKLCADTAECGAGSSCVATTTGSACVKDVVAAPEPSNCAAGATRSAPLPAAGAVAIAALVLAYGRRRSLRDQADKTQA